MAIAPEDSEWLRARKMLGAGLGAVAVLLQVFVPGRVCAQIGQFERLFGATNMNGIIGNGGLSAGLSREGEMTVLKWPSPSFHEHLNYGTGMGEDARKLPHLGALDNMGAFAGIVYKQAGAPGSKTSWMRDASWSHVQEYLSEDSAVLVSRAEQADLGIVITQYSFVLPERDVLVHRFVAERVVGGPLEEVDLIYYENFAPCLQKQEMVPLGCWSAADARNDFALLYDSADDALIHFLPQKAFYAPFEDLGWNGTLPRQEDVDALIEHLDDTFGPGVYAAVGGSSSSSGHQAGFDAQTRCAGLWPSFAEDAYADAQDGALSGSLFAACQANGVLMFPLEFGSDGRAEVSVYVAFSDTARGALSLLKDARTVPAAKHVEAADRWWKAWIGRAILPRQDGGRYSERQGRQRSVPRSDDPDLRIFSKRALITLKIYTDRETGATVDSIQPPWQVWPLDATDHAFALDLAGYRDMAEKENLFLASVQRKAAGKLPFGPFPAGSLAEAYYADGTLAGPIPFIISWTSRSVWSWWTHAKFITDSCRRRRYLETVYPSIRLAVETLADCRDASNGLHCPASCSETFEPTQSLWDAAGVHLALLSAVEAGRLMGEEDIMLDRWEARAEELKEAILRSGDRGSAECEIWWTWPSRVMAPEDSLMESLPDVLWEKLEPGLKKEAGVTGIFYSGWHLTALARAWSGDPGKMEKLRRAIRVYTSEAPTPGTHHLGDDLLVVAGDEGEVGYLNVTSTPNAFSSSNIFIAAMAAYNPELFEAIEKAMPDAECAGGCGCQSIGKSTGAKPFHTLARVVVLLLFFAALFRSLILISK